MHIIQTFQHLRNNLFRFPLRKRQCQVFLQVPALDVFHGDKDGISRLEPAVGTDKAMRVLIFVRR